MEIEAGKITESHTCDLHMVHGLLNKTFCRTNFGHGISIHHILLTSAIDLRLAAIFCRKRTFHMNSMDT